MSAVRELVRELGCELQGEPGLAGAAGAGDRDEPLAAQQVCDVALLGRAPDEGMCGFGQRRPVEAAQRRERAVAELIDPLRPRQVLEPMLAEVDDIVVSREQVARRLGEQHLAAVARGRDPRRAMHVHADVARLRQQRLAGMDADPSAERMRGERGLRRSCGGDRIGRAREGDEERVALGVDLDAVVRLPGSPERCPMQSELGCVRRRSDLVQQRRRAFDVGEEERNGAGWPFWHGNRIAVQACCRKRPGSARRLASAS